VRYLENTGKNFECQWCGITTSEHRHWIQLHCILHSIRAWSTLMAFATIPMGRDLSLRFPAYQSALKPLHNARAPKFSVTFASMWSPENLVWQKGPSDFTLNSIKFKYNTNTSQYKYNTSRYGHKMVEYNIITLHHSLRIYLIVHQRNCSCPNNKL